MGLILIDSEEICTNEERFLAFIPKLVNAMGGDPFALYVDQLSVHKTKEVWKLYHKYDIQLILNIPASPEMNPIESCFSQVKRIYKQKRLNALVNEIEFDMDEAIERAFEYITPDLVKNCAARSFWTLHNTIV